MATDGTLVDGGSCEFRSEYEQAHGTLDGTLLDESGGRQDGEGPDGCNHRRCLGDLGLDPGDCSHHRYLDDLDPGDLRRRYLDDLGGLRHHYLDDLGLDPDDSFRRRCLEMGDSFHRHYLEMDDSFHRHYLEMDDSFRRHFLELGERDVMDHYYFLGRLELDDVQQCRRHRRLEGDDEDLVRESRRSSNR